MPILDNCRKLCYIGDDVTDKAVIKDRITLLIWRYWLDKRG